MQKQEALLVKLNSKMANNRNDKYLNLNENKYNYK